MIPVETRPKQQNADVNGNPVAVARTLDSDISLDPPVRPSRPPLAPDPGPLPEIPGDLRRHLARHQLLLPLLRQSVIATAVADVEVAEEDRVKAQQAWGASHGIRSADDLQKHLRLHELAEADVLWQAELPARIERHCHDHFLHRAEQRFLARKNQLDQVIYSLLRVEDGALARELYLRIAEGEADFAELATTYAKGPERSTRGVVGPVPLLQAHPSLAELLRTSRPGQLHPPLQIDRWWLVVRLETLRSASFDDEMQRRMARELFEEWVDQEVQLLLKPEVAR